MNNPDGWPLLAILFKKIIKANLSPVYQTINHLSFIYVERLSSDAGTETVIIGTDAAKN